jgi:general secretion pathway protein I
MTRRTARGFTLVEVLVALMVVALGLAALMVSVSGAARTSGYLREKTLAQWIAMNRVTEVRLNNNNKFAQNTDTGEVKFANRTWHYDTKYFDTTIPTMRRIVVRVYAGDAKTKGNPLAEATGFLGTALSPAGSSDATWIAGATPPVPGAAGIVPGTTTTTTTIGTQTTPIAPTQTTPVSQ